MNVDRIVAERRRMEEIVDNCPHETPEQIAQLFEAYTHLIWKYQQVGRIYDYYYEGMIIHREGGDDLVGVDQVVQDTLQFLAAFPDLEFKFNDIWCVGNPADGFRFGQSVHFKGTHSGPGKYGPGNNVAIQPHEMTDLCQCLVKFVDGKWRVVEEWGVRSTEAMERIMKAGREDIGCETVAAGECETEPACICADTEPCE